MKVCAANHGEICFAGELCPVCIELARVERLQRQIGALELKLSEAANARPKESFSRREAWEFLGVSRRSFTRYIEAGLVQSRALYSRNELVAARDRINRLRGKANEARAELLKEAA